MAKFKCIQSGNVVEFTAQVDIDSMKGHEGYIRLEDEPTSVSASNQVEVTVPKKTAGRPPKSTLKVK